MNYEFCRKSRAFKKNNIRKTMYNCISTSHIEMIDPMLDQRHFAMYIGNRRVDVQDSLNSGYHT